MTTAPTDTAAADPGLASGWSLDPDITFLNHGSFGACPVAVLDAQAELRARMERDPVRFLDTDLEVLLDEAREQLGAFLGADPADLVFLANATTAINTVVRSIRLEPGDELLTTDHEYNAVLNTLHAVARDQGATVVVARVPFPIGGPDDALDAVLERAGPRTRLAVISHVTSATALVLPIERIVPALAERGIDTLVDGAHAPGQVPLDIRGVGAAYYAGNGHKWLCAPKGAAFLHVRRDRQADIRPLVVSHGANSPRHDRSRFLLEADWTGTPDPTPILSMPPALGFLGGLLPGAWPALMARNHRLALQGRAAVSAVLGVEPLAPDAMVGAMAAIAVPERIEPRPSWAEPVSVRSMDPDETLPHDPLHKALLEEHGIQVPVYAWPPLSGRGRPPMRLLRISAQAYNDVTHYERLAAALRARSTAT